MKTKMKFTTLTLAVMALLSSDLKAQDGSLDLSFDADGIVTTPIIVSSSDKARAMCLQPDGKILLAGHANSAANDFALVRYNSDGSLDLSFDADGKVTTAIGSGGDLATAITLQPDGKILVAGYYFNGTNNDFALVRYNSDGSLDLTFDSDGIVTTAIGSANDYAYAIGLQPDGKILLAGNIIIGTNSDFVLVRYNSDGSLDLSFDTDGKVTTGIGSNGDAAYSMILQPDGKILLAGNSVLGSNGYFALVRYNSDGSLDLSFDTDGKVTTDIGSSYDLANAVILEPNGKILLAGYSSTGTNNNFALVRYNSDGSLDSTFNINGKVTTAIRINDDVANAMSLQLDGKILLAGYSSDGTYNDFALVRYNSDGSLDSTFNTNGKVITAIGTDADAANAMILQSDGKILLAGEASGNFALVRYNNNITTINTIETNTPNLLLYPNPFNSTTTIEFGTTITDAELSIYNMFGQKVKTISNISDTKITLTRAELSSGFYVLRLIQNKKVVATGKMVVVD